jgi:hypothetical protein
MIGIKILRNKYAHKLVRYGKLDNWMKKYNNDGLKPLQYSNF